MKKTTRNMIKTLLQILGVTCLLGHSIVLSLVWFTAYFNNYQVVVTINSAGEVGFELFIIPITLILGIYGLVGMFSRIKRVR